MTGRVHVLTVAIVAEPLLGEWCDACLLPSVVECLLSLTDERGRLVGTSVMRRCLDGCED